MQIVDMLITLSLLQNLEVAGSAAAVQGARKQTRGFVNCYHGGTVGTEETGRL
jgi:hypothetical protein